MSISLIIATGNMYAALGLIQQGREKQPRMVRMTTHTFHPGWSKVPDVLPWNTVYDVCTVCERTDHPHVCGGLCRACYRERQRVQNEMRRRAVVRMSPVIPGRWVRMSMP